MGRIKTRVQKSATRDLMEKFGDRFSTDFNQNKKVLADIAIIPSKKLRNVIAGYAARLKKASKE